MFDTEASSTERVRFEPERTGTPFLFFFWSPERRPGPFRHIAAKFNKPIIINIQQNKGELGRV